MSPPGCQKMLAKPCNQNAEESFPVHSLKSQAQKPPNPLLIQDKNILQPTHRVMDLAVRLVVEDGLPYRPARWHLWRDHRVFLLFATVRNWAEAGGKKGPGAYGYRLPGLGLD